jgi:hypothetical protein
MDEATAAAQNGVISALVARSVSPSRRMLGHLLTQVDHHLIDITPPPRIGRVIAFHHRMTGLVKMRGGMFARRIIAAADMTADATDAQMNPPAIFLETFLATIGARRDGRELTEVGATAHVPEGCAMKP